MKFSRVVREKLRENDVSVAVFASKLGFSYQYVYDLLNGRGGRRWNEDSMNKACEILDLELSFKEKEGHANAHQNRTGPSAPECVSL